MPYATPQQLIQDFGLDEVTQLLADEQGLLTPQLLTDAIAGTWSGSPSQAEKDAALGALARLTRKIETVSNTMDSYLRAAVTLPLSPDNANIGTLNECCIALTRCGLADDPDNATELMLSRCDNWRAWLKDVARGVVQLVTPTGEALPSRGRVRFGQALSAYDWDSHRVAR